MTVDEIKEKYHCDKRQTGQLFVTNWGSGASFASGVGQRANATKKEREGFKSFARQVNRPGKDPLVRAAEQREAKALRLKIDKAVKQYKELRVQIDAWKKTLYDKFGFSYTEN